MNNSLLAVAISVVFAAATSPAFAQTTTSVSTGGAGGQGGAAAGGAASGGTATNNTSGVSNASGGAAQGGSGGTASGGSANASGGSVGTVTTGASSAYLGDITVNYNVPSSPQGKAGLGVGVDPNTGHVVTDNTVNYQGSYKLKNTPDVSVGGPASGPCNGFSGGVGFSMAGMSVGANASTVDEGCSARETARVAAMIGRMDIANAIMDNLPIVQAALKAKAAREALALPAKAEAPATTSPAQWTPAPAPVQTQEQREAALREQQRLAQEALQRQATMVKVNDTLKFTDATTQASEKTPQELMAEEATRKLAGKGDDAGKLQTNARPALPATPPVNKVEAAPNTPPLALQQSNKPDTIARAPDRNASTEMPSANIQATAQQTARTEPTAAKVFDNRPSAAALTPEERVKAAKAALNLQ